MYIYIYFFFLLVHVRIFDSHFFSSFLFFFINSNEKKQSSSPHLPSLEYLEWVFQILILNDHRKILKLRYTFFNFSLSFSFRLNRLSFDWHIDDGGSRIPSNFNENRIRSEESDGSFFFFLSLRNETDVMLYTLGNPIWDPICLLRRWSSRLVLPRHPQSWLRGSK